MASRKRKELPRRIRLASKFQTWRLNQLGRLTLVDKAEPITSEQAWEAIAAELEALGLERFPGAGETWKLERGQAETAASDGSSDDAPHD
jgi:hypothetical protein